MIKNTTKESAHHSATTKKAAEKKKTTEMLSPKVKKTLHSLVKSTRSGAERAKFKTIEMMIEAYKKLTDTSELSKNQHDHPSCDLGHLKSEFKHMGKWIQSSEENALEHCKHLLKCVASLKTADDSFKPGSNAFAAMTSQCNKIEDQIQDFMSALMRTINKHSVNPSKQSGSQKPTSTTAAKKTPAKKIATTAQKTATKKVAEKSTPVEKVTVKKTPAKKKAVAKKK